MTRQVFGKLILGLMNLQSVILVCRPVPLVETEPLTDFELLFWPEGHRSGGTVQPV